MKILRVIMITGISLTAFGTELANAQVIVPDVPASVLTQTQNMTLEQREATFNVLSTTITQESKGGLSVDSNLKDQLIALFYQEIKADTDEVSYDMTHYNPNLEGNEDAFESSGDEDYLQKFIDVIGSLKDPRALDLLMDPYILGTGHGAMSTVAAFGDSVVARTVAAYTAAKTEHLRFLALEVMADMTQFQENTVRDLENLTKIEDIFLTETSSSDYVAKIAAINGLESFIDDGAIQKIEQLSRTEPNVSVRQAAIRTRSVQLARKKLHPS